MFLSDQDIRWRVANQGMIQPFEDRQVKEVDVIADPRLIPRSILPNTGHEKKKKKVISFGTSSYGYDMRLGYKFRIFTNLNAKIIDPKNFDDGCFTSVELLPSFNERIIIPPNSFALGESIERFKVPRDVVCLCLGKSTYARCGIIVNVTPFEPEWEGYVTIEISNTAPLPAYVYPGEGIAQVMFAVNAGLGNFGLTGSGSVCLESYADKGGKYQDQSGITLPKV